MKIFNKVGTGVIVLLVFAVLGLAFPKITQADILVNNNGSGLNCSGDAAQSAVCQQHVTADNPLTGCPNHCGTGALNKITNVVAFAGGAAAVIVIIVGAIRFITSGGNTESAGTARKMIVGALIGLVIIVLAQVIISYVLDQIT